MQGNYSLTAKATDNLGASTTSTPVPVTVAANAPKIYDIYTDHINTPRVVTDQNGNEVWRWDSAPFGETLPNEQPTQATAKFTFNFRFPGQYFDAETNLHYNYFRDYDPQAGRYVESDPIGLNGGINTYAYVSGRPFEDRDRFGLQAGAVVASGGLGAGVGAGAALGAAVQATGVVGAGLGSYAAGTWVNNHYRNQIGNIFDWLLGDPWIAANRPSNHQDPVETADSISKAQASKVKERPSISPPDPDDDDDEWDGAKKRPKQNRINSIKKSIQNMKKSFKDFCP